MAKKSACVNNIPTCEMTDYQDPDVRAAYVRLYEDVATILQQEAINMGKVFSPSFGCWLLKGNAQEIEIAAYRLTKADKRKFDDRDPNSRNILHEELSAQESSKPGYAPPVRKEGAGWWTWQYLAGSCLAIELFMGKFPQPSLGEVSWCFGAEKTFSELDTAVQKQKENTWKEEARRYVLDQLGINALEFKSKAQIDAIVEKIAAKSKFQFNEEQEFKIREIKRIWLRAYDIDENVKEAERQFNAKEKEGGIDHLEAMDDAVTKLLAFIGKKIAMAINKVNRLDIKTPPFRKARKMALATLKDELVKIADKHFGGVENLVSLTEKQKEGIAYVESLLNKSE